MSTLLRDPRLALNRNAVDALGCALSAIYQLDEMGCAVIEARLTGRNPVLVVDREPAGVTGAWCSQERRGALVVREMVAHIEGCEVRWQYLRSARVIEMRGVA